MGLSAAERTARYRERKYSEINCMEKIPCACGCGVQIAPIRRKDFRPAKYARGHNPVDSLIAHRFIKGHISPIKGKKTGRISPKRGQKLPIVEVHRRTATRRARLNGGYISEKGLQGIRNRRQNNPSWYTKVVAAIRLRDMSGVNNPQWQGGKSFEPYDEQFNWTLKAQIWERDNSFCQDCQVHLVRGGEIRGNVHHIDEDKSNSALGNLVLLCASCHRHRHGLGHRDKLVGRKSDTLSLHDDEALLKKGGD